MPRSMGPSMPRSMGGPPGGFASPSQNPKRFSNQVTGHLDSLLGQMNSGGMGGGRVYRPDFGPQGGGGQRRHRRHRDTLTPPTDPNAPADPNAGPQAFGTYAPSINADQFGSENFTNKGLKGNKQLDAFGGLGSAMMGSMGGGMGSMGMGGFGGGMGGGFDIMSMLMSLLGQFGDNGGPIRGR